jgi:putative intracellular protease/amidase
VPGGIGSDHEGTDKIAEFIRYRYPSLKYLITVCTGADLAARAGVLDGRKATTNKKVWV